MIIIDSALAATEKFRWALALLPGILTAACVGLISNVLKLSEIQIFLIGALISIPLLIIIGALLYILLFAFHFIVRGVNYLSNWALPVPQLRLQSFLLVTFCIAVFISPFLGVNLAILLERDAFHSAASTLALFGKLDAESFWSPLEQVRYKNTRGALAEKGGLDGRPALLNLTSPSRTGDAYFEVHLKGGAAFVGWPRAYGLRGAESEIYLSPACEIGSNKSVVPVPGPGVVVKEREITFIVLVDLEDGKSAGRNECWQKIHP